MSAKFCFTKACYIFLFTSIFRYFQFFYNDVRNNSFSLDRSFLMEYNIEL